MASIGQELKRERELRGISLKDISKSSKISLRLLEALEEDRLDLLPGKFFIKAIICTYAKFIGLEEDSILNKYYEASFLEEQSQEPKSKKRKTRPLFPKNIKKLAGFLMLTIFFLILFYVIYLIFLKKETSPLAEELTILTQTPVDKTFSLPVYEHSVGSIPEEKKLNLEIYFLEETWLQVYIDGELKLDGLKQPGEKVTIEALEEFLIHLGNAGGISYTLNNKEGKPIGSSGVVVRNLRITKENYMQYLIQENITPNNL